MISRNKISVILGIALLYIAISVISCKKDEENTDCTPLLSAEEGEANSGGLLNTVFDNSSNAFGFQASGLDNYQELLFFVGNSFFKQNWVSAPASTTARDGLGPTFNGRTCSSCHFKDGRGRAPDYDGEVQTGYLIRLSTEGTGANGEPIGDINYGGQFQDQAIQGVTKEGSFVINYEELLGEYPDGETYSLRKPNIIFTELNYGELETGIMTSARVGQQLYGMGLLEAISEADLLALSDENDQDRDGISGKPNYVHDFKTNSSAIGRFGWKANQPNLTQQTADAFHGDMGITTDLFLNENCPTPQIGCADSPNGGSPEIPEDDLGKVVLYVSNLAVPGRRNHTEQEVLRGKKVFNSIGCASCHQPTFTTSTHTEFDHLANQKIWPYTDLLLHDMGEGLADGRHDYQANGSEWRTQPLWGIGLIETVNSHTNFLHDGRARNLSEAILWHGGEAEISSNDFKNLTTEDREALLFFLNSL